MPDDKKIKRPLDSKRIDINDPNEVSNWTKAFGVSAAELKTAVEKVGDSAEAVRKHLNRN